MKNNFLFTPIMLALSLTACANTSSLPEESYIIDTESRAEKQARMAWWKEARFGMFVHWGLYSTAEGQWGDVEGTEWIQKQANVPADIYEEVLVPKFNPADDFATQWARLAKQAGAKYVVFTTKHHEGFSLHDSAETEFDAESATGRDLHREIVSAIRREDLKVGVYYSLWDWHHPDAPAGEGAVNIDGLTMEGRDLSRYRDYFHAQVNEITDGRYGPVDILWLDFSRNQYQGEAWGARALVRMIRDNQPEALINNRLWKNEKKDPQLYEKYWLGDFSTPEQHIPATGIEGIDWETCDTLNGTWGWAKHKTEYKTSEQLIHRLVDAVSKGGNYLLNIGPLPDGTIHPTTVQRFADIGSWMQVNGEAIYGTQAGPFNRLPWGRATTRELDDGTFRLYLHVFNWPDEGELLVPGLQGLPVRNFVVGGDVTRQAQMVEVPSGILLKELPMTPLHPAATVIALDFDRKPQVAPYRVYPSIDGTYTLEPVDAFVRGAKFEDHSLWGRSSLDSWETSGSAVYPLQVEKDGLYSVTFEAAVEALEDGNEFVLVAGEMEIPIALEATGGTEEWKRFQMDPVYLTAGVAELELRCIARQGDQRIAFSDIVLEPLE